MEIDEKKRMVSVCPLFKDIPQEELDKILGVLQDKMFPAHTIVFRQGDLGDSFYIIYSGKARVYRKSRNNVKTELAVLGPGDSVGEMSLMTGERRFAYLETMEPTHMLVLTKPQFDEAFGKYPTVTKAFVKQMTDKLLIEREVRPWFKLTGMSWLDYIFIIGFSLLCGLIFNNVNPNGIALIPDVRCAEKITIVDPSLVMEKYQQGRAVFIDARPAILYEQAHIAGALNIPLNIFDVMYMMLLDELDKKKAVVVYGRTISRRYDEKLAGKMVLRGHHNVVILNGGLAEWKRRGYPVAVQQMTENKIRHDQVPQPGAFNLA